MFHACCSEHVIKFDHINPMKYFFIMVPHAFANSISSILRECILRNLVDDKNLVDPASSHMLVSKIKPCMSQCKLLKSKTANGSLKQL